MQPLQFEHVVDAVLAADQRYAREAYYFVREVIDYTQRQVHQPPVTGRRAEPRHVTCRQVLDGLRELALAQLGPMAFNVLAAWGILRTEDVGEIIFNLVDHGQGMFNKTDQDTRDAFCGVYDFEEVFRHPFLPAGPRPVQPPEMREA